MPAMCDCTIYALFEVQVYATELYLHRIKLLNKKYMNISYNNNNTIMCCIYEGMLRKYQ